MREVDPRGVEQRKSRCLRCRMNVLPGPNFCWHIDGYDSVKAIWVFYSWLCWWVQKKDYLAGSSMIQQKSKVHAKILFKSCQSSMWMSSAHIIYRFWHRKGLLAVIRCYLRADGLDEYAWWKSNKYVTSNGNQWWVVDSHKFWVGVCHPDPI